MLFLGYSKYYHCIFKIPKIKILEKKSDFLVTLNHKKTKILN
jgi:hypothetical protein